MAAEHTPIQTPNVKQLVLTLLLFVMAMLAGNALLLALESQLGLYSYIGHSHLQLIEAPLQWLTELAL